MYEFEIYLKNDFIIVDISSFKEGIEIIEDDDFDLAGKIEEGDEVIISEPETREIFYQGQKKDGKIQCTGGLYETLGDILLSE